MIDDLNRIEAKLDKVADRIGSIDSTLAAQHESLKDHIRRTEILEKTIEPIKSHVAMIQGALKLLGALALISGVIETVVLTLDYIRK